MLSAAVRVLIAVIGAVAATLARRIRRGPAVPGRRIGTEVTAAALRSLLETMTEMDLPVRRRFEARSTSPVPRHLRPVVTCTPATVGGVPGEWLRRSRHETATMLYLHGGGYVTGSPGTHRHLTSALAWTARLRVFSLDYRLAPEHPFPAALDDAVAAYRALLDDGTDPADLFVAGDSAGGGLTMSLLVELRRLGLPQPAGAVCFSPYTDLTYDFVSWTHNAATDYLPASTPDVARRTSYDYCAGTPLDDPRISTNFADLSGLAPLLVFGGSVEQLIDSIRALVAKADADGADITYREYDGMFHVWPAILPNARESYEALDEVGDFIAARRTATLDVTGSGASVETDVASA